jgi:hypothetical protein
MPRHFGIRITQADKDKLVGELDVDERHLNNSGHVHGGALAAFADDLGGTLAGLKCPTWVSDNHDRIEDEYLSRLSAGAAYRRCRTGPCGAAHDRSANLNSPPGRKARRNDDSNSDGAPEGDGDGLGRRWRKSACTFRPSV